MDEKTGSILLQEIYFKIKDKRIVGKRIEKDIPRTWI